MSGPVILVNGVPASGKSRVARLVAEGRGWPILGLDTVKEPFFQYLDAGDREFNRRLGRASYHAIFDVVGQFPAGLPCLVDAWFGFQPLEVLQAHIARSGATKVIEIWCHAPPEIIGERYAARVHLRPAGHPGLDYVPELIALARRARPMGCYPLFEIETNGAVDEAGLFEWIDAHVQEGGLAAMPS